LREYAAEPGYSHGDYADTMRQAADELDRRASVGAQVAPSEVPEAAAQNGGVVRAALIDLIGVESHALNEPGMPFQLQQNIRARFARARAALAATVAAPSEPVAGEARQTECNHWSVETRARFNFRCQQCADAAAPVPAPVTVPSDWPKEGYPDSKERIHSMLLEYMKSLGLGTGEKGWIEQDVDGRLVRDTLSLEGELTLAFDAIAEKLAAPTTVDSASPVASIGDVTEFQQTLHAYRNSTTDFAERKAELIACIDKHCASPATPVVDRNAVQLIVRDVAELDYSSDKDTSELMQVSADDLERIVTRALKGRAASEPEAANLSGEEVQAMLHGVAAKLGMRVEVRTTVGSGDLNREPIYCLLPVATPAAVPQDQTKGGE
jgi:hypothetical protein